MSYSKRSSALTLGLMQDDVLRQAVQQHIDIGSGAVNTRDDWLDLLMSHVLEPQLGMGKLTFIYGYPPSQASLACTFQDDSGATIAARFELYVNGIELANGYHELVNACGTAKPFYSRY